MDTNTAPLKRPQAGPQRAVGALRLRGAHGIQIVGRTYGDQDVFTAGLAYEAALGGWFRGANTRPNV